MADLEQLLTYLTLISVPIGVFYHIMTLNNTRKNQQMQLETRQAQLLSTFTGMLLNNNNLHETFLYWFNHPKISYKDFKEQYPPTSDGYKALLRLFTFYETIGLLCRRGFMDSDLVHDAFAFLWDKCKPIVKGWQEDMGSVSLMEHYEWFGEEQWRIQEK